MGQEAVEPLADPKGGEEEKEGVEGPEEGEPPA